MTMKFWRQVGTFALMVGVGAGVAVAVPQAAFQAVGQTTDEVPADLRPLLSPPLSEMRLVTQRYTMDRNTLNGNYLPGGGRQGGGGRGGRGGGQAAAPAAPAAAAPTFTTSVSPNRIARLKRFDLDWQAALAGINAASLSPAAQTDLTALKAAIETNLRQLDADAAAVSAVMPVVPFAPDVIAVIEHRMRMGDMDAQASAAALDRITKSIARVRGSLQAGLAPGAVAKDAMRITPAMARNAADAVDAMHASFTEWFNHYNTFDPLFTWWVPMPWAHLAKALTEYAAFLREPVAAANHEATGPAAAATAVKATIEPAPAPAMSSVPNLHEIIALPSDEMAPIVQRFRGVGGGRGGAPAARPVSYYERWLAALRTLDFDRLTRNAQVSYLYVKKQAELEIARAAFTPETNAPRKTDDSGITGAARGRTGLIFDLGNEMIPYTPEELIRLGEREFAWTVAEMEKAAKEMGLGSDWGAAVERVKNMYVAPGRQPEYVRDLLFEAVTYLRNNDLITVPAVASESFRMVMLSPQRQLTAPFFLGGSQILVAFPTNTQEYDTRMQVLRGNNKFFSNAVAHHEMIPGHNLVGFMGARFNGYRASLGGTPFLGEGWPLYWETILYDKGFHDSPEKKVGALFWRMHRAARIVFSLKFHMGQWSPQEAINFLVNEVGHERDNARAEVKRSFEDYPPLYQMAYLVGGLQIRGMKREIVDSGMRTEKDFHDEIMRQGSMPVAFLRLAVSKQPLTRDMVVDWKFYGELK